MQVNRVRLISRAVTLVNISWSTRSKPRLYLKCLVNRHQTPLIVKVCRWHNHILHIRLVTFPAHERHKSIACTLEVL